ncbi:MAG: PIN domain-containing protein [Deltaproteobacteria bacterium]|nr:PIN domain-containing protein [Deltaproteobacteria bacterium]
MTWLLDGNVLVALTVDSHLHHDTATRWFHARRRRFATCVITAGTLLRVHMTVAEDRSASAAWATLEAVMAMPSHEAWGDPLSFIDVPHRHLQGPKQVTDAWLAQLARLRGGRLATFDRALLALHADVAELVVAT